MSIDTKALIGCCAVTRAQLFGRSCRSAQQAPEGVMRSAQHAFVSSQQATKILRVSFSPRRREKKKRRTNLFRVRRRRKYVTWRVNALGQVTWF